MAQESREVPGLHGALGKIAVWLFVSRNFFVFQMLLLGQWSPVIPTCGKASWKSSSVHRIQPNVQDPRTAYAFLHQKGGKSLLLFILEGKSVVIFTDVPESKVLSFQSFPGKLILVAVMLKALLSEIHPHILPGNLC